MHTIEFACPSCRNSLVSVGNSLLCSGCNSRYGVEEGVPRFIESPTLSGFEQAERNFHTFVASQADDAHGQTTLRGITAHRLMHNAFTSLVEPRTPVLEVACGTGADTLTLAEAGFYVSAIDISEGMVDFAKKRVQKARLVDQVAFSVGTAKELPFFDRQFAGVLICAALHHMESPEDILREIVRVTIPGGAVVIGMEPNSFVFHFRWLKHSRLGKRALRLFRHDYTVDDGPPGDMTTDGFSLGDWARLGKESGLEILSVNPMWYLQGFASLLKLNRLPTWVEQWLIYLDMLISKVPLAAHVSWKWLVIARTRRQ